MGEFIIIAVITGYSIWVLQRKYTNLKKGKSCCGCGGNCSGCKRR